MLTNSDLMEFKLNYQLKSLRMRKQYGKIKTNLITWSFLRIKQLFYYFRIKKNFDIVRGSLNKFPDLFRMGTFIDSTHMKLESPSK